MLNIFYELFYTFVPKTKILAAPVFYILFLFDKISRILENGSGINSVVIVGIALLFIEQLLLKISKKLFGFKKNVSIKHWAALFLLQIIFLFLFISINNAAVAIFYQYYGHLFIFFGLGAIFYYVFYFFVAILRKIHVEPEKLELIFRPFFLIFLLYPFLVLLSIFAWFGLSNNPQASKFFIINAAIKNTCFIDPRREHCPHNLEEIAIVEPEAYQRMVVPPNQVKYQYDAEKNLYSLVVRYSPTMAAVFDWRLVDEYGLDLKEYNVKVLGKDRLIDPPDWDGPWEFEDWEY